MKKNAHINQFADKLADCSLCSICNAECPVFTRTGMEKDGPRGHVYLIRQWLSGHLTSEDIAPGLERCLLCGKCARVCPARIPLPRIFIAARLDMQSMHSLSGDLFLHILALPASILNNLQIPIAFILDYLEEFTFLRKHLPPIIPAQRQFLQPSAPPNAKILLFSGCMARRVYPDIARACMRALETCGYEVLAPNGLSCCAMPHLDKGLAGQASRLIKRNLRLLSKLDFDKIVSPCPECLRIIGSVWSSMPELDEEEKKQAQAIASRVADIYALIADKHTPAAERKDTFWQQPCHLDESSARVAQMLCGMTSPRISDPQACCGAPFGYRHELPQKKHDKFNYGTNQLGQNIAMDIVSEILASGAKMVVTGCPHCRSRLENTIKAVGFSVPVSHAIQIIAPKPEK